MSTKETGKTVIVKSLYIEIKYLYIYIIRNDMIQTAGLIEIIMGLRPRQEHIG